MKEQKSMGWLLPFVLAVPIGWIFTLAAILTPEPLLTGESLVLWFCLLLAGPVSYGVWCLLAMIFIGNGDAERKEELERKQKRRERREKALGKRYG